MNWTRSYWLEFVFLVMYELNLKDEVWLDSPNNEEY